jgi:hypothetical protein
VPFSGVMNPKPFASLNHFTTPIVRAIPSKLRVGERSQGPPWHTRLDRKARVSRPLNAMLCENARIESLGEAHRDSLQKTLRFGRH